MSIARLCTEEVRSLSMPPFRRFQFARPRDFASSGRNLRTIEHGWKFAFQVSQVLVSSVISVIEERCEISPKFLSSAVKQVPGSLYYYAA